MKLHEALRQAVRQFGMNVLQERRLVFILSDLRAFGEFPAMRKVMEAIVSGGSGKELCRIGLSGSADEYRSFAAGLEKTLAGSGFSGEFAHYALGCVSYALGFASSVSEPSDHGFDPRGERKCRRAGGTGRHEDALRQHGQRGLFSRSEEERYLWLSRTGAIFRRSRSEPGACGSVRLRRKRLRRGP